MSRQLIMTIEALVEVDDDADDNSLTIDIDRVYATVRQGRKGVGKLLSHHTVDIEPPDDEDLEPDE